MEQGLREVVRAAVESGSGASSRLGALSRVLLQSGVHDHSQVSTNPMRPGYLPDSSGAVGSAADVGLLALPYQPARADCRKRLDPDVSRVTLLKRLRAGTQHWFENTVLGLDNHNVLQHYCAKARLALLSRPGGAADAALPIGPCA